MTARLPEQRLYDWFRRRVGHLVHSTRIENRMNRDTPDLFVAYPQWQGWIEMKALSKFPARQDTLVRLPKWTTGQRYWAKRHIASGGRVALLIEVDGTLTIWRADDSPDALTTEQWGTHCIWIGTRNAGAGEILAALAKV